MPEPMAVVVPLLCGAMMLLCGVFTDLKVQGRARLGAFLAFMMIIVSLVAGVTLQELGS